MTPMAADMVVGALSWTQDDIEQNTAVPRYQLFGAWCAIHKCESRSDFAPGAMETPRAAQHRVTERLPNVPVTALKRIALLHTMELARQTTTATPSRRLLELLQSISETQANAGCFA